MTKSGDDGNDGNDGQGGQGGSEGKKGSDGTAISDRPAPAGEVERRSPESPLAADGAVETHSDLEWLFGDSHRRALRRRALIQLGILILSAAFLLTQIQQPFALGVTALVLISGFVRLARQASGFETSVVGEDERADGAVGRTLRDGGLIFDAPTGSGPPDRDQMRLAIQDQMDLIQPGDGSWWSRGQLLGPVLTAVASTGFLALGTWYWMTDGWELLAWGGWTIGVSLLIGGGIQRFMERRRERALDLLAAQMDALSEDAAEVGRPSIELSDRK